MSGILPLRRALISVSDKHGLVPFAEALIARGVELTSTGGTARTLRDANLKVHDLSDYTGFPEILDGRVKTLHPKVFGGILARADREEHLQTLREHGMLLWDLVVVNLYPFESTISRGGVSDAEAIEQIDIGGPSLIRAGAKNFARVTVATDARQYAAIAAALNETGGTSLDLRRQLAGEAFQHTAGYDQVIARYFQCANVVKAASEPSEPTHDLPEQFDLQLNRQAALRYGENPHQSAAVYRLADGSGRDLTDASTGGVLAGRQLHGKELSYNNYLDLDSAWTLARGLVDCGVAVIKHNNPCGAASSDTLAEATRQALAGDPVSAFGSILGMNSEVDRATAEVLSEPGLFIEAIVAPSFATDAVEILTSRPKWKQNVRLLAVEVPPIAAGRTSTPQWEFRPLGGGMLVQTPDTAEDDERDWQLVTTAQVDDALRDELRFAWRVVRYVKSNAIVVTRHRSLCGAGAGQMSRVDSVEIALRKAGERSRGAVLASDAFFPFDDSIHHAAQAGIRAIIQPGGSKRDDQVIEACNAHQLVMIFTGRRHFRH